MPKVFVTRLIPEEGLALIEPAVDLDVWPDELPPSSDDLLERVRGIAGLLCLLTDTIDAAVIDAAGPGLRVISQMAVGFDNIDVGAATARRIPVGNTPGVLTEATADFTWALLLAAARRVVEANAYARAGRWRTWGPTLLLGADVSGATLGIIGLGRIGQAVAQRARGFNMRLLYFDREPNPDLERSLGVEYAAFGELLARSDFVSIHTTYTESTHHLFDDEAFGRMKPTAVLVNTARGPIVEREALYRALSRRKIAAAALDVTEPEPIGPSDPLMRLDNLIVTPHIASASRSSRGRMAQMAAENLLAGVRGERLPNCVNPEVYRMQE
jgi:glyoxylate reductase